jgi:hypothetical protein
VERLCSLFEVGSGGLKCYRGEVFVDAQAMYLIVGPNVLFIIAGSAGGLLGAAAGASSSARVRTCLLRRGSTSSVTNCVATWHRMALARIETC